MASSLPRSPYAVCLLRKQGAIEVSEKPSSPVSAIYWLCPFTLGLEEGEQSPSPSLTILSGEMTVVLAP